MLLTFVLFDLQQHGFLCRYLVINECPEVPACITGWQPMRRQDRGDVGGGISSKVDELRMDASSKGLAWLQGGSKVALAALRNALVEHFAPQASFFWS